MKKLQGERGKFDGEVILYRLTDGAFAVYRDIPGVGAERDTGTQRFSDEAEALSHYESVVSHLKRMNSRPRA